MLRNVRPASLEDWLRVRYFDARIDISSSGVYPYHLNEICSLAGFALAEFEHLAFRDSPSLGQERLRQALTDRFAPGTGHAPLVTNGSTEAILLAVSALVSAGDEVVVTSATYQSLSSLAESAGAKLTWWELDPGSPTPDLDRLRSLVGPRTRAVIVNFPHNPSGITLTAEEYRDLVSIVDNHGAYLLWDAAFGELVYDSAPLPDPSTLIERCVTFGTLSKAYGLPGLRVGWCIAPDQLLADMVRMRDYVTLNTSPLLEEIATRVIENGDAVLRPRLEQARNNRAMVAQWLADNIDVVAGVTPGGGVTVFPRVVGVKDARPLCEFLADEASVLTVPGDCFGHPERIRLGFGGPQDELRTGLVALADVARGWGARP
jgi:capreomycidine synthase